MNIKLAGFSCDKSKVQTDAHPETIATAYARISRSFKTIQELRDDAIEKYENAEKSYENIVHGMGHASIQEHIVFHFDLEGVSRLAAEYIEHHRLCSFTERSYRYCDPTDVKNGYYTSDLFPSAYFEFIQDSIKACTQLKEILMTIWQENGYSDKQSEIKANEDARLVLPFSQLTSIGMTINARNLSRMIRRLRSSYIRECISIADSLEEEVLKISPAAIRHLKPSVFERMEGEASYPIVKPRYMTLDCCWQPQKVQLLESLIMQCPDLHTSGLKRFSENDYFINRCLDQVSLNDALPREFELIDFVFGCIGSASFYAQLKRHRMATIIAGPYDSILGCTVRSYFPERANIIVRDMFLKSNELIYSMMDTLSEEYKPYSPVPYLCLNAHRRHHRVKMNFRELVHFFKLRCSTHAQEEIRSFAIELKSKVFDGLSRIGLKFGQLEKLLEEVQYT